MEEITRCSEGTGMLVIRVFGYRRRYQHTIMYSIVLEPYGTVL